MGESQDLTDLTYKDLGFDICVFDSITSKFEIYQPVVVQHKLHTV